MSRIMSPSLILACMPTIRHSDVVENNIDINIYDLCCLQNQWDTVFCAIAVGNLYSMMVCCSASNGLDRIHSADCRLP